MAGSHLHVRRVDADATTVILIAGFGRSREIWKAIEAPIAQNSRSCSYDRHGIQLDQPAAVLDQIHELLGSSR